MFNTRGKLPTSPKAKGAKRHLHAVIPTERKTNPTEESIPWKTIILTTIVTSMVSTGAVTLARWLLDRAKERREAAFGQQQQQQLPQSQPRLEGSYMNPMFMLPAPTIDVGGPPVFQSNPFASQNVQRSLSLPPAPHLNPLSDTQEPSWFRDFRENIDRRVSTVESRQRSDDQERDQ